MTLNNTPFYYLPLPISCIVHWLSIYLFYQHDTFITCSLPLHQKCLKKQLNVCKNQTIVERKDVNIYIFEQLDRKQMINRNDLFLTNKWQHALVKHIDCWLTRKLPQKNRPNNYYNCFICQLQVERDYFPRVDGMNVLFKWHTSFFLSKLILSIV